MHPAVCGIICMGCCRFELKYATRQQRFGWMQFFIENLTILAAPPTSQDIGVARPVQVQRKINVAGQMCIVPNKEVPQYMWGKLTFFTQKYKKRPRECDQLNSHQFTYAILSVGYYTDEDEPFNMKTSQRLCPRGSWCPGDGFRYHCPEGE